MASELTTDKRMKLQKADLEYIDPAESYIDGGDHKNTMPWLHSYLHDGRLFYVTNTDSALTAGASIDIVVEAGATKNPHLTYAGILEGDYDVMVYRSPTFSANGTVMTIQNENEEVFALSAGSGVSATAVIRLNPTVVSPGTLIDGSLLNQVYFGALADRGEEKILKRSTDYLYRLTNQAGQNKRTTQRLTWYEHDPVGNGVT
jgi:hypothetical protein